MPGLLAPIATTARGLLGLSKAAVNAEPVDDELLSQRRRVCAHCPSATRTRHLGVVDARVLSPMSVCDACKCNLHAKTRLASQTCPRNRW